MIVRGTRPRDRENLLSQELIVAIERTRSRLAVAVAAQRRTLSGDGRQFYFRTEERMRKWLKKRRGHQYQDSLGTNDCSAALNLLNQPVTAEELENRGEARVLCERLSRVLCLVEKDVAEEQGGKEARS
jgi:hypothetical protein